MQNQSGEGQGTMSRSVGPGAGTLTLLYLVRASTVTLRSELPLSHFSDEEV